MTAGGLVFVGWGDAALNAVDALTGDLVWRSPLGQRTTATPMTYRTGRRQHVVIATGSGENAELVAFARSSSTSLP